MKPELKYISFVFNVLVSGGLVKLIKLDYVASRCIFGHIENRARADPSKIPQ